MHTPSAQKRVAMVDKNLLNLHIFHLQKGCNETDFYLCLLLPKVQTNVGVLLPRVSVARRFFVVTPVLMVVVELCS